jgi:hypothetical protein
VQVEFTPASEGTVPRRWRLPVHDQHARPSALGVMDHATSHLHPDVDME